MRRVDATAEEGGCRTRLNGLVCSTLLCTAFFTSLFLETTARVPRSSERRKLFSTQIFEREEVGEPNPLFSPEPSALDPL